MSIEPSDSAVPGAPIGAGAEADRRAVRTYSGRSGRLTRAQSRALESLWPRYSVPEAPGALDLDAVFGRHAPRVLEIGFGSGHALAEMAAARPERDYLGVEVYRPGIGSLLLRLEAAGIGNVRVLRADAREVLARRLAPESLHAVLVYFPDPWPKKRHHKRRLVQRPFLDLAWSRLVPGGTLHLATDWAAYADEMMAQVGAHPGFRNHAGPGRFAARPPERPLTRFERRGERLGHSVRDLLFERVGVD